MTGSGVSVLVSDQERCLIRWSIVLARTQHTGGGPTGRDDEARFTGSCAVSNTQDKKERERERKKEGGGGGGGISTVRISTSRSSSAATTGIQSSSSTIIQEQKQGLTRVRNECSSSIHNSTQLASCCSSGWRWRVRIVFMAADRCYPEGNGTTTGIFVTFPATGTERPQPLRSFP